MWPVVTPLLVIHFIRWRRWYNLIMTFITADFRHFVVILGARHKRKLLAAILKDPVNDMYARNMFVVTRWSFQTKYDSYWVCIAGFRTFSQSSCGWMKQPSTRKWVQTERGEIPNCECCVWHTASLIFSKFIALCLIRQRFVIVGDMQFVNSWIEEQLWLWCTRRDWL